MSVEPSNRKFWYHEWKKTKSTGVEIPSTRDELLCTGEYIKGNEIITEATDGNEH